jgi:hypothetical protein
VQTITCSSATAEQGSDAFTLARNQRSRGRLVQQDQERTDNGDNQTDDGAARRRIQPYHAQCEPNLPLVAMDPESVAKGENRKPRVIAGSQPRSGQRGYRRISTRTPKSPACPRMREAATPAPAFRSKHQRPIAVAGRDAVRSLDRLRRRRRTRCRPHRAPSRPSALARSEA